MSSNIIVHFIKDNTLMFTERISCYKTKMVTEVFNIENLYDKIIICFTKEYFKIEDIKCKFCINEFSISNKK